MIMKLMMIITTTMLIRMTTVCLSDTSASGYALRSHGVVFV